MHSQGVFGFHANDRERCEMFIKDDSFIIRCDTDTDFLGSGMYFWTTKSDANWWLKEKKKEVIVQAYLCLDSMLDLTDVDVIERIQTAYDKVDRSKKSIEEKINLPSGRKLDECPGIKLKILFEAYPKLFNQYDIIKGRQQGRRQEKVFFFRTRLTTTCMDMYCARNDTVITERSFV